MTPSILLYFYSVLYNLFAPYRTFLFILTFTDYLQELFNDEILFREYQKKLKF